jgi:hypothetical protein
LDAVVTVSGEPAEVDENGLFAAFAPLDTDAELIEVVASEPLGEELTASRVVFLSPPTGGAVPFSVFYPVEGMQTKLATVRVMGGTAPDGIVTVNGDAVEVDERGVFETTLALEEGPNLIEVVASQQLGGPGRAAQITVFHTP